MTFGEMKKEVFRRLEERSSAPVFWEEADVAKALNEGWEELADACEFNESRLMLPVTTAQLYYRLNVDTIRALTIKQAYNHASSRWLEWTTVNELDRHYIEWQTVLGQPDRLFTRGGEWLGFWPLPATNSNIEIFFTSMPAPLASDTEVPGLPQEFHFTIIAYALYDLFLQDAEIQKGMEQWQEYKRGEMELKRFVDSRARDRRVAFTGGTEAYPNRQ